MDDGVGDLRVVHDNGKTAGQTDDQRAFEDAGGAFNERGADLVALHTGDQAAENADGEEAAADLRHIPAPRDNAVNHDDEDQDGDDAGDLLAEVELRGLQRRRVDALSGLEVDLIHRAGLRILLDLLRIAADVGDRHGEEDDHHEKTVFPAGHQRQAGDLLADDRGERVGKRKRKADL